MYACRCSERKRPIKERNWMVVEYQCHYSAFCGYRETYSDYSLLECQTCHAMWRTKANYVATVRIAGMIRKERGA